MFVLMVLAFALKGTERSSSMEIDHNKYINIRIVVKHFGKKLSLKASYNHAITSCDTTFFMLPVGKDT